MDQDLMKMISGGIGGMFLGGGDWKNPADAAMPYLSGIGGAISPYYNPYIEGGKGALDPLQEQYGSLLKDPTALMNKIGSTYQPSPGYGFNVSEATRAANQASAAGGMVGSPQEQAELAKTIQGISSQDYNQYLQTALGQYGMGLQGMGDIQKLKYQTGYSASNEMATDLATQLMMQAKLKYAGQAAQNEHEGGMFSSLGGMIGGAASLAALI